MTTPGPEAHPAAVAKARMLVQLAFVTGMLDIIGWTLLTGFFPGAITGDWVQTASYTVPGRRAHVLQVVAVLLSGSVVGTVAVGALHNWAWAAPAAASILFTVVDWGRGPGRAITSKTGPRRAHTLRL